MDKHDIEASDPNPVKRDGSFDALLQEAFRAGHKRGMYAANRGPLVPDFPEWRASFIKDM